MALTKDQKTAQISELAKKLKDAKSVIFSTYIGLNVSEVSDLRSKLREQEAEMKVAKKTLIKLAFQEAGYPDIEPDDYEGAIACIFSFEDPLSGAQIAFKFAKKNDNVELVGGVFDGKVLTAAEAKELAQMPSREELLAKFVGMLQSPLRGFASICSSPLSGFARALDQMAEKGGFTESTDVETANTPTEESSNNAEVSESPDEPESSENTTATTSTEASGKETEKEEA